MSIHGICFDEGQSGNCGCNCRGFLDGECDIPEEIAENCIKHDLNYHIRELLGDFRYEILKVADKLPTYEQVIPDILEMYGYKK